MDELAVTDFERRPGEPVHEGGISYFRRDLVTYLTILDRVKRKPKLNRGFAVVTVQELRSLGFQVYGNPKGDVVHVCLHCGECDGAEHDCVPKTGPCPLVGPDQPNADDDAVRRLLLKKMSVLFQATPKEKIIEIFGDGLSETDPKVANNIYEARWASHQSVAIKYAH